MRIVLQRVSRAQVSVNQKIVGQIEKGYVLLVAFKDDDSFTNVEKMAKKIIDLRVFEDEYGKMNRSIKEVKGDILSISQFTLYGDTKKGNRPSFTLSMKHDDAKILYDTFNKLLIETYQMHVETGIFGADMKVLLENDGPVTIILEG